MTKKHKQPDGFAPGIYFNMPDDTYHNDKALSHSGITNILVSLMDYWEGSPLNPYKDYRETDALKFGKRCHMMLLEKDKFLATHNIAGGSWQKGKPTIPSSEFQLIKESTRILRADPETNEYFLHGYPEVSIFWIDPATGIRLRIRVDYLRTFGCVDLKRLRSIQKKKIGYDVAQYGYDLQDHLYREGVRQAKIALRAGKIKAWDATKPDSLVEWKENPAWLKAFMDDPDTMFQFFVQRSVRPYIYKIWYFDEVIRRDAEALCQKGILKYKHAIETYGETGWPYGSARPEKFTCDDMPMRHFD